MAPLAYCDELIYTTLIATAIPSIAGGLFVLVSFLSIPKLRNATFGLILVIAMADSLLSVGFVFPPPNDRTWECRLQGWWLQFFPMTSVYVSLLATIHIFFLITRSRQQHMKDNTLIAAAIASVLLAFITSVIPFLTDQYGKLGAHCWIALNEDGRSEDVGFAMRFGLEYSSVWAICLINSILYIRIFQYTKDLSRKTAKATSIGSTSEGTIKRKSDPKRDDKVMQVVFRLMWYPIIMFMSWAFLIAMRLYQFYSIDTPCWCSAVGLGFLNMQGFWNCVVFVMNDTVWKSWYGYLGWSVSSSNHHRGWTTQMRDFYRSSSRSSANSLLGSLRNSSNSRHSHTDHHPSASANTDVPPITVSSNTLNEEDSIADIVEENRNTV